MTCFKFRYKIYFPGNVFPKQENNETIVFLVYEHFFFFLNGEGSKFCFSLPIGRNKIETIIFLVESLESKYVLEYMYMLLNNIPNVQSLWQHSGSGFNLSFLTADRADIKKGNSKIALSLATKGGHSKITLLQGDKFPKEEWGSRVFYSPFKKIRFVFTKSQKYLRHLCPSQPFFFKIVHFRAFRPGKKK